MSRKITRITQDKKLLLANKVVEGNTKIRLDSGGRLDVDEIIEYPAELEGGRNLVKSGDELYGWQGEKTVRSSSGAFIYTHNPIRNAIYQIEVRTDDENLLGAEFGWQWSGKMQGNSVILSNEWQRVVSPYFDFSGAIGLRCIGGTGVLELRNIKVELGSTATDWTPAPEDLGLNYPDSIQNFNSSINGNNIIVPEFIEGYPFVKPVIDDSLVLWLDGSTGNNYKNTGIWKDLSGNGNDGQLMNFDFTEDSGWVDGGLRFDGVKKKDYVLFSKEMLVQGCSFSIDFWTKLSGIGTNCFFCTRTVLGGGVAIFALSGNKIRFDTGRDGYHQWQTSYGIPTNELVNIVVTKDDNYKKLYVNGKPHSSTGTVGDMSNLSNVSTIGASQIDNQSYNNFLKGDIYSFRIYNRALTYEEILQNYQAGQCSPLLAMRGEVFG